jgi:hypothetical protein
MLTISDGKHCFAVAILYIEYLFGFPNPLVQDNSERNKEKTRKQEICQFFQEFCHKFPRKFVIFVSQM